MTNSNTPRAWAKLRANTYLYGAIIMVAVMFLAVGGVLTARADALLYCSLLPLVLLSDFRHIRAICTGDTATQREEQQVWEVATAPFRTAFRRARRFYASDRPRSLRELGSIGMDLARTQAAGRQSGGHKAGAGGHRKPASGGSDDDGEGEPPAHLPLIWTIHDLAATLAVSAKTLQNQPPHHLPPAIRIPGCRGPRYRLQDVLAWLDGFSAGQRPSKPLPRKVRGRPRIASAAQIAALRGEGV